MTDRMRKALELIASGEGPMGGRLGYDQMRAIAQAELTVLAAQDCGIRISDGMADLMTGCMLPDPSAPTMEGIDRPGDGYTAPEPEWPLPPLIVRDLLK